VEYFKKNKEVRRKITDKNDHHVDEYHPLMYEKVCANNITKAMFYNYLATQLKVPRTVWEKSAAQFTKDQDKVKEMDAQVAATFEKVIEKSPTQDIPIDKLLEIAATYEKLKCDAIKKTTIATNVEKLSA
jgi:hypothetical protein